MAGPLIVTAELGARDFGWLNDLRRRHYPAERNQLAAHLTMFHALPPSSEEEVRHLLGAMAGGPAPRAFVSGVMNLGGGVAFRIASEELNAIRAEIADRLSGLLTAQDRAGWSAHVTVQNKVSPREAKGLLEALGTQFDRRPIRIAGLGLHRYLGGPWETLRVYAFRG
jgi:2'-5' RNA ligase superfamily protein